MSQNSSSKLDQNSISHVIECNKAQCVTWTFISCPSFGILDDLELDEIHSGPYLTLKFLVFYIRFPCVYTLISQLFVGFSLGHGRLIPWMADFSRALFIQSVGRK